MNKLTLFADKEINGEEYFSPQLKVYESSKTPSVVSLVTKGGPGLRLNRQQIMELNLWLDEWLLQHE